MPSNIGTIVTWILRLLVAAAFLAAAFFKLSGQPQMVEEFGKIGLGGWFLYVTGTIELIGALLVLNPRTTPCGALLLLCVMVGAFAAQIGPLHGDFFHVFGFAAVLAILLYLTRRGLTGAARNMA